MKFSWVCGSIRLKNKFTATMIYAAFAMIVLLPPACSSHPHGPPGKGILNESRLADLLVDMHYYESVYSISGHYSGFRPDMGADSLDFYQPVLEMHGIGRDEFVETMRYYSYNPPQFEQLYNRVVDELNRRHTLAQMERSENPELMERFSEELAEPGNMWVMAEDWVFPVADTNEMISFEIPVFSPGIYTFSADIRVDPEDYSENPAVDLWFWHDDGTESGQLERFGRVKIIKDGRSRNISISAELSDPMTTYIRGRVLDMTNPGENGERHAEVRNISLTWTRNRRIVAN